MALKILSYFTVVIPLGFAAVYGAAYLYGRVSKKEPLSSQDKSVNNQAKKTIIQNDQPIHKASLDITPFLAKAKSYAEKQSYGESGSLLSYITKILNDSQFQSDPENFMKNWKQKRGGTEEFRIPEDQGMIFFEKEVLPNIKFDYAIITVNSGLKFTVPELLKKVGQAGLEPATNGL